METIAVTRIGSVGIELKNSENRIYFCVKLLIELMNELELVSGQSCTQNVHRDNL